MPKIPTFIPKPLARLFLRIFQGSTLLVIYRVIVLALTVALLYTVVVGGAGFLIAFLITSVIAAWYMDDILATIRAIWNANFYEIKL
jgi:hypothetical protein